MAGSRPVTSLEQRLVIWEMAQSGQTDPDIAQQLGLSASVVRKWRRRGRRSGRAGLGSRRGRPANGALSQWSSELRERLRQLRREHPGWGPLTLRTELAREPQPPGPLPSRARIAAFLKAEGWVRRYEHRTVLAQPSAGPPSAAHAQWQMDAQGVQIVAGVGRVAVINVGDPYSRVLTDSLGCPQIAVPKTDDYRLALRRAFLRFGLPHSLSLDHDRCFFDGKTDSPYPTRLHLWLLALGVTVSFIRFHRPTQHGFIERAHQTMTQQALTGQTFAQPTELQAALDARRAFLNADFPSRASDGQAPLQADPAAAHSGRPYAPEREAELLDPQRVYAYLAQHRWFRRVSAGGQFALGDYHYGLGLPWAQQAIQLSFDPSTVEWVCQSEDGQKTQRLPARGLTPADWMGELQLDCLPNYQLAFPWSPAACRFSLLLETQAGTN